jgi:L-amino acid N-acyltransferase YncA
MGRQLRLKKFRDLLINDPFFDSLKNAYQEFPDWFASKADEDVYVVVEGRALHGMIYLKTETGRVEDVTPPLPRKRWLKVGTLKIDGRGTKLGERVIKKIFDTALAQNCSGIYVTVFELHAKLIALFERYGFVRAGVKNTDNGTELVFVRDLQRFTVDNIRDYPFIRTQGQKAWLLAIYPEYHTKLLPDSILSNEPQDVVDDVSPTNTIHKVYVSGLALSRMSPGDAVIFYRTSDGKGKAYYRSVVTSVCVVEEVRKKKDFANFAAFHAYTRPRSVLTEDELRERYSKPRLCVAKLTYNAAFNRRIIRGRLLDDGIVSEQPRWDFRELDQQQFREILNLGEVSARLVID